MLKYAVLIMLASNSCEEDAAPQALTLVQAYNGCCECLSSSVVHATLGCHGGSTNDCMDDLVIKQKVEVPFVCVDQICPGPCDFLKEIAEEKIRQQQALRPPL